MLDVSTMEFYSAIKNEVMPGAEKWMTLEITITISKTSQDSRYHDVSHMEKVHFLKSREKRKVFGKKKDC